MNSTIKRRTRARVKSRKTKTTISYRYVLEFYRIAKGRIF